MSLPLRRDTWIVCCLVLCYIFVLLCTCAHFSLAFSCCCSCLIWSGCMGRASGFIVTPFFPQRRSSRLRRCITFLLLTVGDHLCKAFVTKDWARMVWVVRLSSCLCFVLFSFSSSGHRDSRSLKTDQSRSWEKGSCLLWTVGVLI